MKKNLLLLLAMYLIFYFSYPEQIGRAIEIPEGDYYVIETVNLETSVFTHIDNPDSTITIIPKNEKVMVIGEAMNSKNEPWLQVQYQGSIGWIQKNETKMLDLQSQYFTSSATESPIRRGATTTYKQVGALKSGEIVQAIEGFTNREGEKWIRIHNGQVTGWVLLSNMEFFDGQKNYLNKNSFISQDTPVRRGASYGEEVVFSLSQGTQVSIQSSIYLNDETWYRITDGKQSGWIPASETVNQLEQSTSLYVQHESVTVHRGANRNYKVTGNLTFGKKVKTTSQFINGDNELWNKVLLDNGKEGWVLAESLSTKKIAFLTVDDGPSPYTKELLDTLKEYHAKATFFMINGNMEAHPSEVERMAKEGHALGSHSVTHSKSKFYRSPASAVQEMETTQNTIKEITGITSHLIRVPYGSVPYMKKSYRDAMDEQDFIMWDWNIDSLDWKFNNSDFVNYTLQQVKMQEKNKKIPTILIHDRKATVENLPALLKALEEEGYLLVPINESNQPYQFKAR